MRGVLRSDEEKIIVNLDDMAQVELALPSRLTLNLPS